MPAAGLALIARLEDEQLSGLNALVEQSSEAQTLVDVLLLTDPVPNLKAWAATPPQWMNASGAAGWITFGYTLVAHALSREAATAWQRALDRGAVPVEFWQGRRALELAAEPDLALDALPPDAATSTDPFVRGIHALLSGRNADAIGELERWSPDHQRDRDLRTQLLAGLLARENRLDDAVAVLEEALPATEGSAIPPLRRQRTPPRPADRSAQLAAAPVVSGRAAGENGRQP